MPSSSEFICNNENCEQEFHEKQAFISHSGQDKCLALTIADKGCEIGIASYLFEFSPDTGGQIPPAEVLAQRVAESDAVFVLLGECVSKAFWTQAWIGFEIGVARGAEINFDETSMEEMERQTYGPLNKVIVLQDIRQGIEVCVPSLDAILLLDVNLNDSWNEYSNMAWIITRLSLEEFFSRGNDFQQNVLKANVRCGNVKCKSEYEAWIPISDAGKVGEGCNPISNCPIVRAECTFECPSCDQMVTRVFSQMLTLPMPT